MPETDKREEGEKLPTESSDTHVSASGEDGIDAAAAAGLLPAAGDIAEGEVPAGTPEIASSGSIDEFADNVVSGLEQATLAIHRSGGADLQSEYSDFNLEQMSEVFFAGWSGPDGRRRDEKTGSADAATINLHAVSLASMASSAGWEKPGSSAEPEEPSLGLAEIPEMDLVSLSSFEGGEHPGIEEMPIVEPSSLSELSDLGLASWGASEGVEDEETPLELALEPQGFGAPGGIELASATAFAAFPDSNGDIGKHDELADAVQSAFPDSSGDMGKHDELADAVQSALLSIYGEQTGKPIGTVFQKKAIPAANDPSSLVWNKGSSPASDSILPQEVGLNRFAHASGDRDAKAAAARFAPAASDGLTPQDVILNYFDYPSQQNGNGSHEAPYEPASRLADEEPFTLRPRPEPTVPLKRGRPAQERRVQRPEWTEASTHPGQYSGPPSFPVPAAGPAMASKPAATPGEESSRLLGAAAIGLMGGIAIAASLAAFLIYGPHPATVEIPGIGNLRLDKDEQGYGRAIQEEVSREPLKNAARAPAEYSSEIFAADAVAVPGQPAPLAIGIRSQLSSEKTLVAIAGVPEGGRLSAGVDAGGGSWLVPPKRLNGLTINLPARSPGLISLEVQLLDSNSRTPVSPRGTLAVRLVSAAATTPPAAADAVQGAPALAPIPAQQPGSGYAFTTQTLLPPVAARDGTAGAPAADASFSTQTLVTSPAQKTAAAPLPAMPQAAPSGQANAVRRTNPRPEIEDLIREGNKHMREGDILEARQFYQKAVNFGDPEAALAMGRSYDPIYFARIEKKNAEPDAAKAFDWYKRAMDAGASQTAMVRIENLKHFLNE